MDQNKIRSLKSKRMGVFIPIFMAITTFHMFRAWPILERTWLIEGIVFAFTVWMIFGFYRTKMFLYLMIYCLVLLLNVLTGDDFYNSYSFVIMELFCYSIPAAFTYYFLRNNEKISANKTVWTFFILFLYTVFVSFLINNQMPGVIRQYVGYLYGNYDTSRFIPFFRLGMSNYYLPHAAPALIPALYVGVSNKSLKRGTRYLLVLVWISIIVLAYLSSATTALLFSVLFSIPVFFIKRSSFSKNITTIILVVLIATPIMLNKDRLLGLISYSASYFSDSDFSSKFEDMEDAVVYGQASGDLGSRNWRYTKTINQFIAHPILGTNSSVGEHSAFMDRAACLGLVGFLPYLLFLFAQFKFVIQFINVKYRTFYYYGIIISFLMLTFKYMSNYEMFMLLLTILPLSIFILGGEDAAR